MLREYLKSVVVILLALGKSGCNWHNKTSSFNHLYNCIHQRPANFGKLGGHPKVLACVQEARPIQLRLHFAGPDLINLNLHPAQSAKTVIVPIWFI